MSRHTDDDDRFPDLRTSLADARHDSCGGRRTAPPGPDPAVDPGYYNTVMGQRVGAYLVDVVVLAVLTGAAWLVLAVLGVLTFGLAWGLLPLLGAVPLAYHTLFIGGSDAAATPGMRVFGLTVRSVLDGRRPSLLQAFLMTGIFYVTVGATGFLVLLWVFLSDRRRTLHDALSGTLVLNRGH